MHSIKSSQYVYKNFIEKLISTAQLRPTSIFFFTLKGQTDKSQHIVTVEQHNYKVKSLNMHGVIYSL